MDHRTTLDLAAWFERRLDTTLDFHLPAARLYGLLLNDAATLTGDDPTAARASFIGDDADIYRLLSGSLAVVARSFDAAAVVSTGWACSDVSGRTRPSSHPDRRRIRVVAIVSDVGVRSITRFEDTPDAPVVMAERGTGRVIDAVEAMWFGDPAVNASAAGRSCRRRTEVR